MQFLRDDQPEPNRRAQIAESWGMSRCNIYGCTSRLVTTVVLGVEGAPPFGLCEHHYQEGTRIAREEGVFEFDLDFAPLDDADD